MGDKDPSERYVPHMAPRTRRLVTERLVLRCWHDDDRVAFAAMNADVEVMQDLGGTLDRDASDRKLDRFAEAFDNHGYGRWVIEGTVDGGDPSFLGYAGVMANRGSHPLGEHDDGGWRLCRHAWGHGVASEAARAALHDVFTRAGLNEVVSYTAPDNTRSRAVMQRLGLRRDNSLDFSAHYDGFGIWHGLVWIATPAAGFGSTTN